MPPRATCPCCGQETDRPVVVDLATNTVTVGEQSVKLYPMQAEIVWILARAYPGVVSVDSMIRQIYGQRDEPSRPEDTVRVLIYQGRPKLAPLGIKLRNHWSRGYSLVVESYDLTVLPRRDILAANGSVQ